MTMIALPGLVIRNQGFTATAGFDGKQLIAKLQGIAEMTVTKELDEFCRTAHAAARRYKNEETIVDFRELEFINSSCLKCFVTWLDQMRALPEGERYRLKFLTNQKKSWQARSLTALSCVAADLVSIDDHAAAR